MPKKKKKRQSSGVPEESPQKTVGSGRSKKDSSSDHDEVSTVSILELRPLKSGSEKGLKYDLIPRVVLCEADSAKISVHGGDEVVLLVKAKDRYVGTCIGKIEIQSSSSSTPKMTSPGKGLSSLKPGYASIKPYFAVESLASTVFEIGEGSSGAENAVQTPSTPRESSSKSKFSFATGGGGDTLLSPTIRTPTTPKSPARESVLSLLAVPRKTFLGQKLCNLLCSEAKRLKIKATTETSIGTETLRKCALVIERLMLAQCAQRYIRCREKIAISFQGRTLEIEIHAVEGAPIQPDGSLENRLSELTVDDEDLLQCSDEEYSAWTVVQDNLDDPKKRDCFLLYQITYDTKIELLLEEVNSVTSEAPKMDRAAVAGLSTTLARVHSLLATPLKRPEIFLNGPLKPPRGVLLHGPSGVGKSCLVRQIELDLQDSVKIQHINCTSLQSLSTQIGEAERRLTQLFKSAERGGEKRSTLLICEDIHLICAKRDGYNAGGDRLASTLLALLDGIKPSQAKQEESGSLVVLATTNNPSQLDPALRRPGRLDIEVEVPLPDTPLQRAEILKFHLDHVEAHSPSLSNEQLIQLATIAKGFSGADCMLAVKEACRLAILAHAQGHKAPFGEAVKKSTWKMTIDHLRAGMRATKPSAIKSLTLEVPQVPWSSIGGMDDVKRALREAIELPLTNSELFDKLEVSPPKGILLYGPPGCSKTLMARALATDGQMNFLAVKGPELLSKWLGESERALASLFRRARMASPSIVFFDEIDAIAAQRGSGGNSGEGRLISQLLTELDGVAHTGGLTVGKGKKSRVVVVAATNRPDLIDSALMRPGRIDQKIYVGVPDEMSRIRILELGLASKACASDIDVRELAKEEISGGLSGAEIIASCRDGALFALEEFEENEGNDKVMVRMHHMLRAIKEMPRQITPEMIEFYKSFQRNSKT